GAVYEVEAEDERQLQAIVRQLSAAPRRDLRRENPAEYDPQSPEYQARYGATSGMSGLDLWRAGAGKMYYDVGRGAQQLGAEALDLVAPRAPSMSQLITEEDPSRGAALRREHDEAAALDAPLMNTAMGRFGNIAGGLALAAPTMFVPGVN